MKNLLNKRLIMLTAWTAACLAVPQLAAFSAVVKPLMNKQQPVQVQHVSYVAPRPTGSTAMRYDDGRVAPRQVVCTQRVYYVRQQPAYRGYGPIRGGGWWRAGPGRRLISWPFRRLFGGG